MEAEVKIFYEFMVEYVDFMDAMAQQEDKKYAALISNDLERIDKTIAEQQAMLMKLDKLEEERVQRQKEVGWEALNFQGILDQLEGSDREDFRRLFDRASRLLEQIQYGNQKAIEMARMNLQVNHMITTEEAGAAFKKYGEDKSTDSSDNEPGSVFKAKV